MLNHFIFPTSSKSCMDLTAGAVLSGQSSITFFFLQGELRSIRMESASTTVPSIVVYVTVPNREAGNLPIVANLAVCCSGSMNQRSACVCIA